MRYAGLIGELCPPGGGTTDYAVEVFDHLRDEDPYVCFLREDTVLPMMHMEDAVEAMMQITSVTSEKIRNQESYNIQGISFDPATLFAEIRRHVPDFKAVHQPDYRQRIADGWPGRLDDTAAREDWGWSPTVQLPALVDRMVAFKSAELEIHSNL